MNTQNLHHRFLLFTALLCSGIINLHAQPGPLIKESPHLRIDPEQVLAMQSDDLASSTDAKTDKAGNIYVTGYFSRGLYVGEHIQNGYLNAYAGTCVYLAKYNPNGRLLWVAHTLNNARATGISIAPNGQVWLGATLYNNRVQVVTPAHDTTAIQLPEKVYNSTCALLFSEEGDLKKYHLFDGYETRAFVTDKQNNLYFAGNLEYRQADKPSHVRRRFQLFKANAQGQVLWQLIGDTIGQSFITGIALGPKNTLALGLSFEGEVQFAGRVYRREQYDRRGALLAVLDGKTGALKWAKDTLANRTWEYSGAIAVDKEGTIYAGFSQLHNPCALISINAKGALLWSNLLEAQTSHVGFNIHCTNNGKVYLYGEGDEALFNSKGPYLFRFKANTSTDIFVAQYTAAGVLEWVKTAGGEGTDYCTSLVTNSQGIWLYGHTWGTGMLFKDSLSQSRHAWQFWLARFNQSKLAYVNKAPADPEAIKPEPFTLNTDNCTCSKNTENDENPNGFKPSLHSYVSNNERLKRLAQWKLPDWDKWLTHTFYERQYNSGERGYHWTSMNLLLSQPTLFQHPKGLYGLWINPCKGTDPFQSYTVSFTESQPILKYIPNFDETAFDSTAQSYYHIMRALDNQTDAELLSNMLLSGEEAEIEPWLKTFNKTYHTNLRITASTNYDTLLQQILRIGEKQNGSTDLFLLRSFVLTNNKPHPITDEEERALSRLFTNTEPPPTIKELNGVIYPKVSVTIEGELVLGVTIDKQVLQSWDMLRKRPEEPQKGALVLMKVTQPEWSSGKDLELSPTQSTMKRCLITGTQVLMNLGQNTSLIGREQIDGIISTYEYPQLITDSVKVLDYIAGTRHPNYLYRYHPALENFSGLYTSNAPLLLLTPKPMQVNATKVLTNNQLIAGFFSVKMNDTFTHVVLEDGSTGMSRSDFEQWLKQAGFTHLHIAANERVLTVHFAKVINNH